MCGIGWACSLCCVKAYVHESLCVRERVGARSVCIDRVCECEGGELLVSRAVCVHVCLQKDQKITPPPLQLLFAHTHLSARHECKLQEMSIQAKILVVNLAAALAAACKCTVIMHGNARILAMQEM